VAKICPHCGQDVKERWHQCYEVQKLDRGSGEVGIPVVVRVQLQKETLLML